MTPPRSRRKPPLTVDYVLDLADRHCERTGRWPGVTSGPVEGDPGETWGAIDRALRRGGRGLPAGSSLSRLLSAWRGARDGRTKPPLSVGQIRAWAEVHRARTGLWPDRRSGVIVEAPGETWSAVEAALRQGLRGFKERSSLAKLLGRPAPKRGRPKKSLS
jgi:hypothetical protein